MGTIPVRQRPTPRRIRTLQVILLILVTVTVIDHTSEWLRRKLE